MTHNIQSSEPIPFENRDAPIRVLGSITSNWTEAGRCGAFIFLSIVANYR